MKNTKKITALALALVMALGMAAGFSGCAVEPMEPSDSSNISVEESSVDPTSKPTNEPTPTPKPEEDFEHASVVYISVNPKFALYFDADGKVIQTTAEKDDGEALNIDLADLNNMTSADAVTALLTAISDAGYFDDGEHSIELTFYGETNEPLITGDTLEGTEKAIYEATETFVKENGIKAEITAKKSPDAAPVKLPIEPSPTPTTTPTATPTTAPTVTPTQTPTEKNTVTSSKSPSFTPTEKPSDIGIFIPEGGHAPEDHQPEFVVTEEVKATYEYGGYVLHTCTGCGFSYKSDITAPIPQSTAAPNITETDGVIACRYCGSTDCPSISSGDVYDCIEAVVCSFCHADGHFLYACPLAAEATPEPVKCFYCGSTSCPYPSTGDKYQCPEYTEQKDATKYCQTCGESTSVCEYWIVDKECPRCDASVAAFECHYCPNR